jgi:transketolase-like protein
MRSGVPVQRRLTPGNENKSAKGAYVLKEAEGGERKLTILSTGSELHLAVEARDILQKEGIPTAVISMPCRLLFENQDAAYKKAVLGTTRARVAVEAAVELGWERYIGLEGRFVGMHSFGASGKIADVYKKFDINAEAIVRAAHETLAEVTTLARGFDNDGRCCRPVHPGGKSRHTENDIHSSACGTSTFENVAIHDPAVPLTRSLTGSDDTGACLGQLTGHGDLTGHAKIGAPPDV